ncbi:MAG: threonylcarbamoyl-AMP synthase [Candidatus Aenigmarchaeota archaeon]|nr:threonylcarbamoyl-AMP synthase [Candidatus Aenigmarchaeota archaeon]
MKQIEKAVEVLKIGGVIAYPTETVYGIGANIFDENAVRRVFEIKRRQFNKPLSVAVSNFEMMENLVYLSPENRKILEKLLPGPVTIILPKKEIVSNLITANSEFIGIRFPENEVAGEIISKAKFPITATSANFSGEEDVTEANNIKVGVDFVVEGECKYKKPSTVIDLVNKKILREGVGIEKVKKLLSF